MMVRIPRSERDQWEYLEYLGKQYLEPAKLSGRKVVEIPTAALEWLYGRAWNADRPVAGRAPRLPKHELAEAKRRIANKLTDKRTAAKSLAKEYRVKETYVWDQLGRKSERKNATSKKAASTE
ncbi:hypothetical protein [Bradyrhizobium sp. RDT46]|uniref:hypothetical protein n=1 Tax=Bradyrhizobium sp. RDT46 TaxID=3341829 RepID=UPI0035C673FD